MSEDFWSRYEIEAPYREAIDNGGFVYFVNGLREGRIALNRIRAEALSARPHQALTSLSGLASMFAEHMEEIVGSEVSPYIAGEIQQMVIHPPGELASP